MLPVPARVSVIPMEWWRMAPVNPKIFVVDDDEAISDALKVLLESVGREVETFANGKEFLDAYSPSHGGCLVLDLNMPVMNGQQVLESIAARRIVIPVIVITSSDEERVRARALAAGAMTVLQKPLQPEEFLDAVARATEMHQLAR